MEMILEMLFFSPNNRNIRFTETRDLIWRIYTAAKDLHTIKRVELIEKKNFAKVALDENAETYVIYVAALSALLTHPS